MRCTSCDSDNPGQFQFCGFCGKPLARRGANSAASDPVANPNSVERRQLTVVFCDLVGSVALSQALDPEDLRDVLSDYVSVTSAAIGQFKGVVAQVQGDGIIANFGFPCAPCVPCG